MTPYYNKEVLKTRWERRRPVRMNWFLRRSRMEFITGF